MNTSQTSSMKPITFYGLTLIAVVNLIIGFALGNTFYLIIALLTALYLKPYVKTMPIPKAYLKFTNIPEGTTLEDIKDAYKNGKKK